MRKFWALLSPPPEFRVLRQVLRHDSNCIEVGANAGDMLAEMVRLAPGGRHFAVEAIPGLADRLRQRIPRVNVFNLAASDGAGETEFHHFAELAGFSGMRRCDVGVAEPRVEILRVKTETLDRLIPADVKIRLLKIDVEGAEVHVPRGARELLRRNRPVVIFEHGLGGTDLYGIGAEDAYDLLAGECGLGVARLEGSSPRRAPLTREEFTRHYHDRVGYMLVAWGLPDSFPAS
jgi:FkbM family methyltransferase